MSASLESCKRGGRFASCKAIWVRAFLGAARHVDVNQRLSLSLSPCKSILSQTMGDARAAKPLWRFA
jgi:hypothetical protein